jgi:hypothetical protein
MCNTYGIRSVNQETFNIRYYDTISYPRWQRDIVVTALRVNNAILNVLGYIPGVSLGSGCVRMIIGAGIIGVTLAIGDRKTLPGAIIIGRWYDEAIGTGIAQIARGALEALVPFGGVVNAALDVIATPFNIAKEIKGSIAAGEYETVIEIANDKDMRSRKLLQSRIPHDDVKYPFPLSLLHLV